MAIAKTLPNPDISEEGVGEPITILSDIDESVVVVGDLAPLDPPQFDANLAEYMDEGDLGVLGSDLLTDYDDDKRSRDEWEQSYKKGIDLLGLKIEERTMPWPGACGVFHPILSEAAVRFQSQAIMETFPAGGPVKAKIVARSTPEIERQAKRVKDDLNYFLTERMTEFRSEHERLLFALPLAGAAFKKVYFDKQYGRPTSLYVAAEEIVVPYGASDLQTSPRITHVMQKWPNEIRKLQVSGFYRDVDLEASTPEFSRVTEAKDKTSGEQSSFTSDGRITLLEMHVDLDLLGFEDTIEGEPTGIALPYVVTIDKGTGEVLSIYRNWKEADVLKIKRQHFVQYAYIPGFGFYAFGLIHLIGGIAKSATSILRQLVDAGTLSNLPAGLKARGLRIKGDSSPLVPGEFRDVDVASGSIRDAITFLPYKEPSQVLAALLSSLVEEGRRFASIADIQIGEGNAEAPVGTTLALMERAMKVMSAVQARLHASLKQELKLLVDVIRDNMGGDYEYDTGDSATRADDYNEQVDVVPVSDPNAASMSQRVVQYQAALQLAAQAPQLYDLPELHRQMLVVLGINDVNKIIPSTEDRKPADPVSENMNIINSKPVKAFMAQDHEAHLGVHMAAMQDPKIMQMIGQSPMAGAIQAAAAAHVAEHVAFQYRREMEKMLGATMPAVDEHLPEDIEVQFSRLVAEAAGKLLKKDIAEAKAAEDRAKQEDPVVQMAQKEAAIKQAEVERKYKKDEIDQKLRHETHVVERERIASMERIAGLNAGIKAAADKDRISASREAEQERVAAGREAEQNRIAAGREKDINAAHTEAFRTGLNIARGAVSNVGPNNPGVPPRQDQGPDEPSG